MKGYKTMTKKETEKRDAIEYLKKSINKGDTLYTITTHVSKSGMSRNIKVLDIKNESPSYWNYYISKILGYALKDDGTLKVQGCGMDMGFHVISQVASTLFDDYKKLKYEAI